MIVAILYCYYNNFGRGKKTGYEAIHFPYLNYPPRTGADWKLYFEPTRYLNGKPIEGKALGKVHRTGPTRMDEVPGFDMVIQVYTFGRS